MNDRTPGPPKAPKTSAVRTGTWAGVSSQCRLCKHRPDDVQYACDAFPGVIPTEILENRHDHRRPWIDPDTGEPGDRGVALAGSILFEPADDAARGALENLRNYLDLYAHNRDDHGDDDDPAEAHA